ncbi:hypothetical protein [Pseudomonas aeruginosa]|uniref:hypothetical protein n=1 Tax=Pseudomonas aeruginosa TaxID=287 RepID=UPI00044FCECD|nr:hypothetical protein [Pseudomonas aeruginosa]EZN61241.1 hypothetical protein AJ72_04791 [Pseudomonas aeruginosa BWH032]MBG7364467.1 hypothetical protein [Pseudomonas aeruginosa]MBH8906613.1 hypothetical protein [Pseudomonas aeruginosa]MBI7117708.1 hypothetical protein [Pseudomonas aeruginosa]MBO7975706.1 hypothetical protein [Pseudomonas aeruginosa]
MPKYSYVNIIKSRCKDFARENQIPLNVVHHKAAQSVGFTSYHDLTQISKSNPLDIRLMRLAFGMEKLEDVIYENGILSDLDRQLENKMSGEMAETNATFFTMENVESANAAYDASNGHLTLELSFDWQGEQDEERPWSGNEFKIDALVTLVYRSKSWQLHEELGLYIVSSKSNWDDNFYFE